MTFCGFLFQTFMLVVCVVDDIAALMTTQRKRKGKKRSTGLNDMADDVACIAFAFANVVSFMFYAIYFATDGKGVMDPSEVRPKWLSPSMHIFNSVVAWIDLILLVSSGRRTFSRRSGIWCLMTALAYTGWIYIVFLNLGSWPYPFLNKLPHPEGILGTAFICLCVFGILFSLGSAINMAFGSQATKKGKVREARL